MPVLTDPYDRPICEPSRPSKIISLVPSQTELLFDLGLEDSVVGITKFCIHPEKWFRNKTRVGGTKNLNMEVIHRLKPDLIIANKEENRKEEIEELFRNYPVWVSDVRSVDDAIQMITEIGQFTKTRDRAESLVKQILSGFRAFSEKLHDKTQNLASAYFIWENPYMVAGGDTFISNMMHYCGLKNIFGGLVRYPEITISDLKNRHCAFLLLSSEPFPFREKHIKELQKQLPETKIILVDGEIFSWYGSRLIYAPAYFEKLWKENGLAGM